MKKLSKKLAAGFLAFAMVLTTALPYLPSIDAFAASKTMAHIVSGAENGNTHFAVALAHKSKELADCTWFFIWHKKASFRATENTRRVLHFRWHRDII